MSDQLEPDVLRGKIRRVLGSYRCQYVCDYDGDSLNLNDAIANVGDYETIAEADAELDLLADCLASAIDPVVSTPPRWTPIEEAGEWDGEVEVWVCQFVCIGDAPIWKETVTLEYARGFMERNPEWPLFVFPAPPEFNPEDYEVKP